jgi:aspartokinase-like uncharacterized kinase
VVKLGGSLHGSRHLRAWVEAVAAAALPIVIVPGGGPFADQVRIAQRRLKLSDAVAHRMALLAMEQFGLALTSLNGKLRPASRRTEILDCLRRRQVPVWMPTAMVVGRPDIPESWDVTSDSLALLLAKRLRARGLLLVKSARLPDKPTTAAALARRGIVDAAFPAMLAGARFPCRCIEAREHRAAARALRVGQAPAATAIESPGPVCVRRRA